MQQFDFVTDLYILDLTHEYVIRIGESYNMLQNFLNFEKIPKLRTLKVKHMFVTDEFLEKVSNMKLQSLMFIGCTFLISKDTVQTVQQCKQIEVTFGESYENICFNRCGRFYTHISPPAHKQMIKIQVNINKCVKLRNLAVNMGEYANVMPSDQIVGGLRYLTLGKMNCDRLLSSFRCYGTTPEYLSIDIFDLKLAVSFLKEINRNELKHLVLICVTHGHSLKTCDASNLLNLDFAALKVLEIDAGGIYNKLSSGSTSEIQMRKLETLIIRHLYLDEKLLKMITELEMLKHLEICIANRYFGPRILHRQLSNLKGPIEKLLVSSELTIYELVRSIEPLKMLKEFRIDGRSIQSSFDSLANQNYDKCQPAKVDANEQNLMESKNVVHLKLHTLHVSVDSTYEELIKLMLCQDFEAFADIKKLVIDVIAILSKDNQVSSESSPELLNNLIKNIFETFKQLDVLVFCYKSFHISEEEAHILREFFSSRCKSLKERCEWSDECNEEQTIFELYK
ncbi:hypothetical protein VCUG_00883 [Vavraia culicis subsp. floridensis]|uniref:Uncharacterized protein n=1 Tax=Vavraia culicis (isolate floridensis) TaxID=948595 RepID=L2GWD7_VAVCU|nr:uncharacterized protein VCUG_00883 [Vavraia culicis subsp. floridensis]ELA47682.1 hypothetical protein VCUG_00883 [Vavraia culicis subsp. floridensis]